MRFWPNLDCGSTSDSEKVCYRKWCLGPKVEFESTSDSNFFCYRKLGLGDGFDQLPLVKKFAKGSSLLGENIPTWTVTRPIWARENPYNTNLTLFITFKKQLLTYHTYFHIYNYLHVICSISVTQLSFISLYL